MRTDHVSKIARPYAAAAFAEALSEGNISTWRHLLNAAAKIAEAPSVRKLLQQPGVSSKQLGQFFCETLNAFITPEGERFLKLLADYRRLPALPEIASQFQQRQDVFEKKITVKVTSAVPLEPAYQKKLTEALEKRYERQILLACEVDPTLTGGIIVKVGDQVLDGSVRGALQRMSEYISGKSLG